MCGVYVFATVWCEGITTAFVNVMVNIAHPFACICVLDFICAVQYMQASLGCGSMHIVLFLLFFEELTFAKSDLLISSIYFECILHIKLCAHKSHTPYTHGLWLYRTLLFCNFVIWTFVCFGVCRIIKLVTRIDPKNLMSISSFSVRFCTALHSNTLCTCDS